MKFFITTPIYYVNARPHIGHLYTTIAADVLARHFRAAGRQVLFSTGTDENSQKNVEAATQAGEPVAGYVDRMAALWQNTFTQLGLTHDIFIRTTAPEHVRAVHDLLKKIDAAGDVYLGDYEGYYCVGCEAFIAANELVNGACPIHDTVPKIITEKNYFFRLGSYRERLLQHYAKHPKFVQPTSARRQMLQYIEHELADISISRASQAWGIRLPQDQSHAVYVWFDALINYLTVTGYPEKTAAGFSPSSEGETKMGWQHWWPPDLHLIGKDIVKFHCAVWPAMLMSASLPLPKIIFAHGFFTINSQKISKSLGNAIDPLELIKEYPFDAIRYYLLRDIPFGADGDFSHQRLHDRYNADLANGLGNLVSRVLQMIEKFTPDLIPPAGKTPGVKVKTPGVKEAGKVLAQVDLFIEDLAFDKALESIWAAIRAADEFIEKTKPWKLANKSSPSSEGELEGVLTNLYLTLIAINQAIAPFMPETHQKLTALLSARSLKKPAAPLFARK